MSRRPSPARRRVGMVCLTIVLAAGLSACSATNPITTAAVYEPSDGVRLDVGDVRLGNLIVLSAGAGEPGLLIGYVTSTGTQDARVSLGGDGVSIEPDIRVPAGGTTLLTPDEGSEITLDSVPVPPGAYLTLEVAVEDGGTGTVGVPVLDGTLPAYADLVPAPEG